MKRNQFIKSWMMAGLVAIFISACASTQDEMTMDEDGTMETDQTMTDGSTTDGGTDSGTEATGLDDTDSGDGTAIVDSAPLTAAEMLEQTEGTLANRSIYFETTAPS